MVDKIRGSRTSPSAATTPLQSTKGVTQSSSVEKAQRVQNETKIQSTRKSTRPMTADERRKILQYVDEVADEFFADSQFSDDRKTSVIGAVKMAIASSDLGDIEDPKSKELPQILADKLKK
jgi:hypothetical protein